MYSICIFLSFYLDTFDWLYFFWNFSKGVVFPYFYFCLPFCFCRDICIPPWVQCEYFFHLYCAVFHKEKVEDNDFLFVYHLTYKSQAPPQNKHSFCPLAGEVYQAARIHFLCLQWSSQIWGLGQFPKIQPSPPTQPLLPHHILVCYMLQEVKTGVKMGSKNQHSSFPGTWEEVCVCLILSSCTFKRALELMRSW